MFYSTRNHALSLSASKAILKGLSSDGGLFLPKQIVSFPVDTLTLKLSYQELAKKIFSFYLDDFSQEEIASCVEKAYGKANFEEKVIGVKSFDKVSFLELFYGPTTTFKDMALSILPLFMDVSLSKNPIQDKLMVITATSGDTGSAALNGFRNSKDIEIKVLYPNDGISKIQEKQMLYFTSAKSRAYSLDHSNFDDCQRIIKKLLNENHPGYQLTSANSINIGRLLPQIVYYYASYIELVNSGKITLGEKIDVIVPTGNFGNIFACYLAKKMGLPVEKLVVASNENDVLTEFFKTGTYDRAKRKLIKTNSPSMDILISSNFERLLSLIIDEEDILKEKMKELSEKGKFTLEEKYRSSLSDFDAISIDQKDTLSYIQSCYEEHHYLIDPHTAVSYGASKRYQSKNHLLVVSTASPFKFSETILDAFGKAKEEDEIASLEKMSETFNLPLPKPIQKILNHPYLAKHIEEKEVESVFFAKKEIKVKVPATSANLGVGFDACGIALNLFNTYSFSSSEKNELVGFRKEYLEDNLVLKAYNALFEKLGLKPLPVRIESLKEEIPPERGLGSSSACIVAGLLGANYLLQEALSKEELLEVAIALEGHPDNVACCLLGNLISSIDLGEGHFESKQFQVNPELHFLTFVSPKKTKTSEMRKILPENYSRKEVVYNASRAVQLLSSFLEGDLKLLSLCLDDHLATPSRLPLIEGGEMLFKKAKEMNLPVYISGSGSTIIVLSKDDTFLEKMKKDPAFKDYELFDLKPSLGASYGQ